MQINLQFSEREYLRGKASEIRFSEQKTKIFPSEIISVLSQYVKERCFDHSAHRVVRKRLCGHHSVHRVVVPTTFLRVLGLPSGRANDFFALLGAPSGRANDFFAVLGAPSGPFPVLALLNSLLLRTCCQVHYQCIRPKLNYLRWSQSCR